MPLWYGAKTLGPCGFASPPVARKKEVSVQQGDNMDDVVSTQNAPLGRKDTTKRKGNHAGMEKQMSQKHIKHKPPYIRTDCLKPEKIY